MGDHRIYGYVDPTNRRGNTNGGPNRSVVYSPFILNSIARNPITKEPITMPTTMSEKATALDYDGVLANNYIRDEQAPNQVVQSELVDVIVTALRDHGVAFLVDPTLAVGPHGGVPAAISGLVDVSETSEPQYAGFLISIYANDRSTREVVARLEQAQAQRKENLRIEQLLEQEQLAVEAAEAKAKRAAKGRK